MPPRFHFIWTILLAALLSACASGEVQQAANNEDGGVHDQDADRSDADHGDADQSDVAPDTGPSFEPPEFYHSTSGGGLSTSAEHRMQMNFGAPMPRGTSSSDQHRIQFGPVSP